MRLLARVAALVLCLAMLLAGHPDVAIATNAKPDGQLEVVVVEHLRIKVPADGRAAWLQAEQGSWEPWLEQQDGYLGRDLLWDSEREEGTLLIRWASREQWKAIPEAEVEAVQERFEQLAREATGQGQGNPFPLVFEGELIPAA
ncbi:MAG: TIGR03792 family protein [Cyanobacteria bacterium]|nr:TIGR03792 family protein [Cyanobacteriota bacterium]